MNETVEKTKEVEINLPIVIIGSAYLAGRMMWHGRRQVILIEDVPEQREHFGKIPLFLTAIDEDLVQLLE